MGGPFEWLVRHVALISFVALPPKCSFPAFHILVSFHAREKDDPAKQVPVGVEPRTFDQDDATMSKCFLLQRNSYNIQWYLKYNTVEHNNRGEERGHKLVGFEPSNSSNGQLRPHSQIKINSSRSYEASIFISPRRSWLIASTNSEKIQFCCHDQNELVYQKKSQLTG